MSASGFTLQTATCLMVDSSPASPPAPKLPRAPPPPACGGEGLGQVLTDALGAHLELLGRALKSEHPYEAPDGHLQDTLAQISEGLLWTRQDKGSIPGAPAPAAALTSMLAQSNKDLRRLLQDPGRHARLNGCRGKAEVEHQDMPSDYSPQNSETKNHWNGDGDAYLSEDYTDRHVERAATDSSSISCGKGAAKRKSFRKSQKSIGAKIGKKDEQPESTGWRGRLRALIMSHNFEVVVGFCIFVNTLTMIVEEQYTGVILGYDLKIYSYYGSPEWQDEMMPQLFFDATEIIFALIFTIEVMMRMVGLGCEYWARPSEYFDLLVVVVSDASICLRAVHLPINMQLFRVLRAAKLLRLVKLVRAVEGFDSLHLMTTALHASLFALCWSCLLLLSMQTFIAMLITNLMRAVYLEGDAGLGEDAKKELYGYFGTYTRSMLSLFELALANWTPICRFLMVEVHEVWSLAVLAFKLIMGFAVIGVLNAVFMQETFKVANTDDAIMVRTKQRAAKLHKRKMQELFELADNDSNGKLARQEFHQVVHDQSIQTWLASMDLDASDADLIFDLLCGDDEEVDADELVRGIDTLKGAARSVDLHFMIKRLEARGMLDPWHHRKQV